MKVIYVTSYTFPSTRAEPYYLKSMAEAFTSLLGDSFSLMVRGQVPEELAHARATAVPAPARFKVLYYFFWFPRFVWKEKLSSREVLFMSNDPYLLAVFIFWRKALRLKYRVCSDWHQLFEDWKDGFVARSSDYLIATTGRLKGFISSIPGVKPERILVAYGGIDTRAFSGRQSRTRKERRTALGLPPDAFLVGYVGGFKAAGEEKGLATMIRSLPYLDERVFMVFVGGSKDYHGEYPILARSLGVEDRCIFVGKQPFAGVVEYELALDVLAIPYPDKPHFRNYGFPLKVWEYLASGRPIVYSNLDIIGEVLAGKATPFVPDDPKDFARVIAHIQNDPQDAEEAAEKNTEAVLAYTWDARVSKILDFIRTHEVSQN